jgi:hypothetical protein
MALDVADHTYVPVDEILNYTEGKAEKYHLLYLQEMAKLEEDRAYDDPAYRAQIIDNCFRSKKKCKEGQEPGYFWTACLIRLLFEEWMKKNKRCHKKCIERCKVDPVYFFRNFLYTSDPRLATEAGGDTLIPFVLFEKQVEYVKWIHKQAQYHDNGVVLKCRDMGVSWMNCGYAVWGLLFIPGFMAGFGSNKADAVDKRGDMKSLIEKCRFMIRWVFKNSNWLKEYVWPDFNERFNFKEMLITNNYLGTAISGDSGDNMGTGDRKTIYFPDEWAKVEHAAVVKASVSNVANSVIYTSTPMGAGNDFANMVREGKPACFTFNWTDHPKKTQNWFNNLTDRKGYSKELIAQEVLHDFNCSVEDQFIPGEWVRAAIDAPIIDMNDRTRVAGFDVAAGGENVSVYILREGNHVELGDIHVLNDSNTTDLTHKIIQQGTDDHIHELHYDSAGIGIAVRSTLEKTDMPFNFKVLPFHGGSAATTDLAEGEYRPIRERFLNRRAQAWYSVRERFRKTFEYVVKGVKHPVSALISIPNNSKLVDQLSLPMLIRSENGRIKVESKEDMKRRGIQSPDHADALIYAFATADKGVINVQGQTIKLKAQNVDIQWGQKTQYNSRHYGSVVQRDDLSVWFLATLFDDREEKLYIYGNKSFKYPMIPDIAETMTKTMNLNKYYYDKIICNKGMIDLSGPTRTVQSQFRDEFDRLQCPEARVSECFNYDMFGSIAIANRLMSEQKVIFGYGTEEVIKQLEAWIIEKGEPGFNLGYCECLCLILSELKRQRVFDKQRVKPRDYMDMDKALAIKEKLERVKI